MAGISLKRCKSSKHPSTQIDKPTLFLVISVNRGTAILFIHDNDHIFVTVRGLSGEYEDTVHTRANPSNDINLVLFLVIEDHLAIHIWIVIPKCKLLNKILNIFKQWGVGHGALRPFPWRCRILPHQSLLCLNFKHVREKTFPQSLRLQEYFIKQSFGYFDLYISCRELILIWKRGSVKCVLYTCCTRSRSVP